MYSEGLVLEIFTELLGYGPFKGQELEFQQMILQFSPSQFSAGKCHRVILPIIQLLKEYGT